MKNKKIMNTIEIRKNILAIKTTKFMNMNIMNVIRDNINMMRTKKTMNTIMIKNIKNKTKNTHTQKTQTYQN
jgi:hypothetical protein